MSALVSPISFHEELSTLICEGSRRSQRNKYPKHALRTRCTFKTKCNKILRRKLLKYKLRRNGEEDADVVKVTHILLSSLNIKSPNKLFNNIETIESDEIRPKNYLFNMARRKMKTKELVKTKAELYFDDSKDASISESQTEKLNAFKLLMNSRNKSIGSNSPGKDKTIATSELQDISEKRKMKAKRNLVLQKMANAKGAVKRKELEEQQEIAVKCKMEERAEKLKSLLVNNGNKKSKVVRKGIKKKVTKDTKVVENGLNDHYAKSDTDKKHKSLLLIDIFERVDEWVDPTKHVEKVVGKKDEEFLKKLSPSIRKKENMLSYFPKVERCTVSSLEDEMDTSENFLKVKITQKHKKKFKKKKLSLHKDTTEVLRDYNENDACKEHTESIDCTSNKLIDISYERKKRKRKEDKTGLHHNKSEKNIDPIKLDEIRPKRNVKRPVKYADDVYLSSSDEELHIFTPKKRKHGESSKQQKVSSDSIPNIVIHDRQTNSKIKKSTEQEKNKKLMKLAPIFAPKLQLNPEQLDAKQKFLYSGVPDQIKKIAANIKATGTEVTNEFLTVVHVQQDSYFVNENSCRTLTYASDFDDSESLCLSEDYFFYKEFLAVTQERCYNIPRSKSSVNEFLQAIKGLYPKFPVYRTYRMLKDRNKGILKEDITFDIDNSIEMIEEPPDVANENPFQLSWTEKYKANSTKNFIGNFNSIKELKQWLLFWLENDAKPKTQSNSDSSDFYDSDSNSRDCYKSLNNLVILNGPVGSGKTSCVYAVASELAIKVIEVNASSKRTGKVMLQDLQEATQSHKVNRGGSENSQPSQEVMTTPIKAKRGRPKKGDKHLVNKQTSKVGKLNQIPASQEGSRTGMSLILVDDADIVFDQDDGFSSAIAQLTQSSKRPVILVTESLSCSHLQKFVQYSKTINMKPLSPKMLGTWLDIMCLADSGTCWPGLGAKFLDYFKGDIRKSINCLQFYVTAHTQDYPQDPILQTSDHFQDDENSNITWTDSEWTDDMHHSHAKNCAWSNFMTKESSLTHLQYPKNLFEVWWSIPSLLKVPSKCSLSGKSLENHRKSKMQESLELETFCKTIDTLSVSDYYSGKSWYRGTDLTSHPWHSSISDSVSEAENYDQYTKLKNTTNELIQELVVGAISIAQNILENEQSRTIDFPSMTVRREKDRIVSHHDDLTNMLNPSAALDRRALALDYWTTCRTICRIERNKNDVITKRRNRFCHYLKTMSNIGSNTMFESLADCLNSRGEEE